MEHGCRIRAMVDDQYGGFVAGDEFDVIQEPDGLAFIDRDGESRHLPLHQEVFEVIGA